MAVHPRNIKPRKLEDPKEEVKLNLKMLRIIYMSTATQTLQEASKASRKHVYQ